MDKIEDADEIMMENKNGKHYYDLIVLLEDIMSMKFNIKVNDRYKKDYEGF
jgi:uncharacterized membrane protein YkoI